MIQLRVRTEYSFGQCYAPVGRLVETLKAQGCRAAGIVDRDSTWGHVAWFKACEKAGIQPLLGVELIVSDSELMSRMWFLARSTAGLSELYRASSQAHRQPLAGKRGSFPRLRRADVEAMSGEIIKFAGEVTDGDWLASIGAAIDLSPASRLLNAKKQQIAATHSLPLVSTSDNYFAQPDDKAVFELIGRASVKPSPMYLLPSLDHEDAATEVAAACLGLKLPVAPMVRAEGDLEKVCREGIKARGITKKMWTKEYEARLQYELDLIKAKDFSSYFLIVADMCNYAKKHMLVGPSRGSSAGSLVCYTARITEIDPLPPRLYFERFIDITRSDLPDIDLDFPDDKRDMVFTYMAERWGKGNTAKIGTISKFQPKSALIEVCKSLGISPAATAPVKVAMIVRSKADSRANNCLQDTFETTDPGKKFIQQYPQAAAAALLEGHASHSGVHAAGLLVCNDTIENYATVTAEGIAQVEKGAATTLGLLKIDVLGLRTLGILEDSGVKVDWYGMKFDDPKTYDIFNSGRLCGIFQFEGQSLRAISKDVEFKSINEIDAVTALARPGPFGGGVTQEYLLRSKGKPYESIHPLVTPHMAATYGLPVYQEQTLAIVREIGKFDWKETSAIRKTMSDRKGKEFFDTYWEKFKLGAGQQGIEEPSAKRIWEMINSMGAWQMNKAHTFSYAVISYWTAWLKANHPLEFAAANLRNAKDEDQATTLLREMVREGISYKAFDWRLSEEDWSVKDGVLIGGFTALKGFGESKAKKFCELRRAGKLTQDQIDAVNNAENVFADIFPMQTKYGQMYSGDEVLGGLKRIEEFDGTQDGSYAFIGRVTHKSARNINEEVLIKKRGGRRETGQQLFLDLRLQDDTGTIGARVSRWDWERLGKSILETVPVGADLMVRARFPKGIRYAFVNKIRRLDEEKKP